MPTNDWLVYHYEEFELITISDLKKNISNKDLVKKKGQNNPALFL